VAPAFYATAVPSGTTQASVYTTSNTFSLKLTWHATSYVGVECDGFPGEVVCDWLAAREWHEDRQSLGDWI
jgi:hypothetical protein